VGGGGGGACLVGWRGRPPPYYRRKYQGIHPTRFELGHLPPTSKRELRANFDEVFADPRITWSALEEYFRQPFSFQRRFLGEYLAFHSSGSTGQPSFVVWGEREFGAATGMLLTGPGVRAAEEPGSRRRPRWHRPRLAYVGILDDYVGGNSWVHALRRFGHVKMFSISEPLERLCADLQEFQPHVLAAKPHVTARLARCQKRGQLNLRCLERATVAGECMRSGDELDIAEGFGVPPCDSYSTCETGPIARQVGRERTLAIFGRQVIVELLDEADRPIRGYHLPGRVTVTSLYNRTMPIIRYDVGDVASFVPGGPPFSRLSRIQGRQTGAFRIGEGVASRTLAEFPFWNVHVAGLDGLQVIQTGPSRLRVLTQWRSESRSNGAQGELERRIAELVASPSGRPDVSVEYESVDAIPFDRSGKLRVTVPLPLEPSGAYGGAS
jgi:phenylacetate-CoA ligase